MTESPHTTCQLREQSPSPSVMLTVQDTAALLNCSVRTVYRLVDTRRIPQPVKLGALLRWVKSDVEQWVAAGCPDCRKR